MSRWQKTQRHDLPIRRIERHDPAPRDLRELKGTPGATRAAAYLGVLLGGIIGATITLIIKLA